MTRNWLARSPLGVPAEHCRRQSSRNRLNMPIWLHRPVGPTARGARTPLLVVSAASLDLLCIHPKEPADQPSASGRARGRGRGSRVTSAPTPDRPVQLAPTCRSVPTSAPAHRQIEAQTNRRFSDRTASRPASRPSDAILGGDAACPACAGRSDRRHAQRPRGASRRDRCRAPLRRRPARPEGQAVWRVMKSSIPGTVNASKPRFGA